MAQTKPVTPQTVAVNNMHLLTLAERYERQKLSNRERQRRRRAALTEEQRKVMRMNEAVKKRQRRAEQRQAAAAVNGTFAEGTTKDALLAISLNATPVLPTTTIKGRPRRQTSARKHPESDMINALAIDPSNIAIVTEIVPKPGEDQVTELSLDQRLSDSTEPSPLSSLLLSSSQPQTHTLSDVSSSLKLLSSQASIVPSSFVPDLETKAVH